MVKSVNKQEGNYGLQMALSSLVLFAILISIFYQLQQKKPIAYNAILPVAHGKKIYILKSETTAKVYHQNSTHKSNYIVNIDRLKSYISALGHTMDYINEDKISTLSMDALLIVPDAIALEDETKNSIKSFIKNGGNLFFNFTSGFSDEDGNLIGSNFVEEITKLTISLKRSYLYFQEGLNITQRLLSVLENENSGVLLDAAVYDNVPIFTTPKDMRPDIFMTNYGQINPPVDKNKKESLLLEESACAWHGYYGKGKWFYTNLPSTIFYDSKKDEFKSIMNAIINFLSEDIVIGKFPYIDKEKVVFISEDTEYKFKNFEKFSNLSKKYKIPVTAFIVSDLAKDVAHKEMINKISKNSFIEFASHSRSHKKIIDTNEAFVIQETSDTKVVIDKLATHPITGFRPPREELDDLMKKHLAESGFNYILGSSKEYLYPRYDEKQKNLLLIPRHGTDDYSYLINLDWTRAQIVKQIIKESKFVTGLDAAYTLGIHTHLFAFKSNIKIVEDYFKYLKRHTEFTPMDGRTIAKKVRQNKNIEISYIKSDKQIILDIVNNNNTGVKNLHCKIFKNPNTKITSISSKQTRVEKYTKEGSVVTLKLNYLKPNSVTTVYVNL